jgi:hypothetical protein
MNRTSGRIVTATAMFTILVGGAGCLAIGGSDRTYVRKPTTGEQLMDLKAARDTGALSQAEYERLREELVGRPVHGGN